MKTSRIVLLALVAVLGLFCDRAQAAPTFSAMQLYVLCPDFDGPMGAGGDARLLDAAKRVSLVTAVFIAITVFAVYSGSGVFNNAGTFVKNAGSGSALVNSWVFNNTSKIVSSSGSIVFNGGELDLNAGGLLMGSSDIHLSGGTRSIALDWRSTT